MSIPPPIGLQHPQQPFSMNLQNDAVSVTACISLALLYVFTLYAPTFLLRLPPPSSFTNFMIRRFLCALVSTTLSLFITPFILPVQTRDLTYIFGVYGIRVDHMWQALVLPLSLTSLLYAGSLLLKSLQLFDFWRQHGIFGGGLSFDWSYAISSNVMTWRNYIVGPLTEELVFRACMIPILLCGGFKPYSTMILCPIFFSLAHLNHFMEIYTKHNYRIKKAAMVIGLQLGYTGVFGSYASFLFIRTGHLAAPLVAHVYCNFMGLPVLYSQRSGIVTIASIIGFLGFLWLLFPMTGPELYNDRIDNCSCWQGYCSWRERIRMS